MTNIEIIESYDKDDFKKRVNDFINTKQESNNVNHRAGYSWNLYDLKILKTDITSLVNGKVRFLAVIQY